MKALEKHLLHYETHKLFYNKYLYKLVIKNSLAIIFREKKFNYAREVLDDLQHQFENGEVLVRSTGYRKSPVDILEFLECLALYKVFSTDTDYKIRVENPHVQVYTNDKDWLLDLSTKVVRPVELWQPSDAHISHLGENIIIVNRPTKYQYKVTLGDKRVDRGFTTWLEKNHDKVKIGRMCKDAISEGLYAANYYFYVRDERVLELVKLMITPSIRRIDKLVCKQDIDK